MLGVVRYMICWVCGLLFFNSGILSAQTQQLRFERIDNEDGLSQGTINCIFQDQHGFMWFGTKDGLNKYDGIDFDIYQTILTDTSSISGNHISTIAEDYEGNLWIGTIGSGLNKMDPYKETFVRFDDEQDSLFRISGNIINALAFYKRDILLIGTQDNGLTVLNIKTGESKIYQHDPDNENSIGSNLIMDIAVHENGRIFLSMRNKGFCEFHYQREEFSNYEIMDSAIGDNSITEIHGLDFDNQGNLWLCDYEKGLFKFNLNTHKTINYRTRKIQKPEMEADFIRDILVVDSTIWCATQGWGLCIFDMQSHRTRYYRYEPGNMHSLSNNGLISFFKSRSGIIWIGTNGKGINFIDRDAKQFITFNQETISEECSEYLSVRGILKKNDSLWISGYGSFQLFLPEEEQPREIFSRMNIYCIIEDSRNNDLLWLGDEGSGLYRFYKSTFDLQLVKSLNENFTGKIYGTSIYCLLDDGDYLWAGTYYGLNKLNKNSGEIVKFLHDPEKANSIGKGSVRAIHIDKRGQYWVGTSVDGVSVFDGVNDYFMHYRHTDEPGSLSSNNINSINEDSKGNIWICSQGGINLFDPETLSFEAFTVEDGLPNNVVYAMLEDQENNFWLSTNMGICKFNPVSGSVRNFDVVDGLQGNEFNNGAYYKAKDGEMIFGGINGFTRFYPENIHSNPYVPPLVFTYLDLKNVSDTGKISLTGKKEIVLSHKNSIFEISFAALNFYKPEKNHYKYKLRGLKSGTTDWISLENKSYVDFVGLDPGQYTLDVIGSNNDQIWNTQGASLVINITPPFWKTWIFRIIMIAFLGLLIYSFFWIRLKTIKTEREKLQQLVDEQTIELKNANNTKDKFFSIIGHDLKSPLNSIIGFSSLMDSEYDTLTDDERKQFIGDIYSSSETLLKLTDNLLNWARAQSGSIDCHPTDFDINELATETIGLLIPNAQKKKISISNRMEKAYMVFADMNMIHTVLRNLISNAIKFTQQGGKVIIEAQEKDEFLEISINDNGMGISKKDISKLFIISEKFKTEGTDHEKGTGLGLMLSKEFVLMNKGDIRVESQIGKGSTFGFTLPLSSKVFS